MNMTETPSSNPEPVPEKLLIDDPSNFQFHAAYLVYSDCFNSAISAEVKKELNRNLDDLRKNVISLETFYKNISRYRKDFVPAPRYDKFSVQTQRKRDWRVKSQKQDRIRRHKK
jgi:hypothetical protein